MKKSFYIFLCALLGSLMFLIIHRLLVFVYLVFIYPGAQGMSYLDFLVLDYFTLILVLFAGLWYGIWLGLSWYDSVYESRHHQGFVDSLIARFWPAPRYNLRAKIDHAAEKIETQVWELEDLAKKIPLSEPVPVKRRVVRKRKTE